MGRCLSLKSIPEFEEENEKEKILHQEQEPCLEMSDFEPTFQKQSHHREDPSSSTKSDVYLLN